MNVDEAENCLEKGLHFLKANDYQNAHKFLSKSVRLNPSEKGFKLLHTCEEKIKEKAKTEEQKSSHPQKPKHQEERKNQSYEKDENIQRNFTQTQLDDVLRMKIKKDFYEVLEVAKNASMEEIKKKYKKLALKFHPDKNRAPGSDEIFKKIAQAYDCLTNKEKREVYDQYGDESPDQHYQHYNQRFSENFSPEDIFSFFFSTDNDDGEIQNRRNGRQQNRAYHQNVRFHRPGGGAQQAQSFNIFNMLPILLLFLCIFSYNGVADEPHYLMEKNKKYNIEMKTRTLELSFYVEPSFREKYRQGSRDLLRLEQEIESGHINTLRQTCKYQINIKKSLEIKAAYSSNYQKENLLKDASEIDLSTCREFERIKKRHGLSYSY